jgi:hypothetical protein
LQLFSFSKVLNLLELARNLANQSHLGLPLHVHGLTNIKCLE